MSRISKHLDKPDCGYDSNNILFTSQNNTTFEKRIRDPTNAGSLQLIKYPKN